VHDHPWPVAGPDDVDLADAGDAVAILVAGPLVRERDAHALAARLCPSDHVPDVVGGGQRRKISHCPRRWNGARALGGRERRLPILSMRRPDLLGDVRHPQAGTVVA